VMFGEHKKHDVLSLKEGVVYLRDIIAKELKKGTLRKEYTESHVLDIREHHLKLEKFKNDTIKKIDDIFKDLIQTLKTRKNNLVNNLTVKFSEEKQHVIKDENKWVEEQEICEKLSYMLSEKDETNLLLNSFFIMEGIRKVNEPVSFLELKVYNDIDTTMTISKTKGSNDIKINLSFDDMMEILNEFMTILDPNILQYKS